MSDVTVSGGAGGIGAKLDDMRLQAQQLSSLSSDLVEQAIAAGGKAADGDLLESMVLSPVTGAAAEGAIVVASGSLLLVATQTGVAAIFLEGAVIAYETADQALAALTTALHNGVAFVIGVVAIPLALVTAAGAAAVGIVYAVGVAGYNVVAEGVESVVEGAQKTLDQVGENPWLLLSPAGVAGVFASNTIQSYSPQEVVDRTLATYAASLAALQAMAPGVMQDVNEWLGENAWIADILTDGAPGLLAGLTFVGGPFQPLVNAGMSALTGQPWPPLSYEDAIAAIAGGGGKFGLFDDGTGGLAVDPNDPSKPLAVTQDRNVNGLGDLLQGSADIDKGESELSSIRVIHSDGPPPSWIVQIPSTQVWDPHGGAISNDLTSDIAAMQGNQTALAQAVKDAMIAAGVKPTDPVMLEGFSLGGITAGQMASDPNLGFNVTHVVTAGSPIARFDIPSDVQVMSLEFHEDPVARLDGRGNPDSGNWTTVQSDAPRLGGKNPETVDPGIAGAHNAQRYEMLADQATTSGDPSVDAYLDSAKGFFSGDQTVTDYSPTRK
ncbi:hypothetical protein [Plantibacter sp. YIM 135347]|uniref:hypothetical protein n=1 Tax=Plantibacter sp. YIM 135347 TaxID=3423919 RepID=UPI003D334ADD